MSEHILSRDVISTSNTPRSRPKKNRTPVSCDRCKSRKTKCVNPVPGPCQYCARTGSRCGIRNRPKRPFYHVTEEEYRCSMKILQHFLPSQDLTLETLRTIAKDLENTPPGTPPFPDKKDESSDSKTEQMDTEGEIEEVSDLHEQLGCLMEDSSGEYRYIGTYSEIAFNDAVCSMKSPRSPEEIIEPPRNYAFPPGRPERAISSRGISSSDRPYLPSREYCSYYVAKYFEEVHCVYWFFPAEQFHSRLEDTYAYGLEAANSSWLCSLYSIFALGAASRDSGDLLFNEMVPIKKRSNPDTMTTHDYLALAKSLIPRIHEEADIESIRALGVLSIALQTFGFRVMSYLYIGTGIRIAYSLGFHHDKSPAAQNPMIKQQNHRIWWTLYILDQEIASRCGNPCVCDERILKIQMPLPSEKVMSPGTNTPLGYLHLAVSLCRLKKEIIDIIYPERSFDSRVISFKEVTNFVTKLQEWQTAVPSHLKWGVPVAPTHKRALAILHLDYWNAMMLLTRPFLLYIVLRDVNLQKQKREWFQKLGDICADAAQSALVILKSMGTDGVLSSLVTFDSTCILKVAMIMILALVKTGQQKYRGEIETCLSLLRDMEQIGFCKAVLAELPERLHDLGIMRKENDIETSKDIENPSTPQFCPEFDFTDLLYSVESLQDLDGGFGHSLITDMDMDFTCVSLDSTTFQPNLDLL